MSFSDHKIVGFTHKISDLPDQPNMQPEELKAHFDSSPEELRQALNALCDALAAQTAAADIGFAQTAGVPETTVQEAIENVQSQVTEAIIGSIPSGSITGDKLAQDVRDRFSAIESAAAGEASTRANADSAELSARTAADSNLQTQINAKCEVVFGTYTGDGAATRDITLGFAPKAVLLCGNNGFMAGYSCFALQGDYVQSNNFLLIAVTPTGFSCGYGYDYPYQSNTNTLGTTYQYIAFR